MGSKIIENVYMIGALVLLAILAAWFIYDGIESNKRQDKLLAMNENEYNLREMEIAAKERYYDSLTEKKGNLIPIPATEEVTET